MKFEMTINELRNLIKNRHWENGESIRAIERSLGFSNDTIRKRCAAGGISIRNQVDSIKNSLQHRIPPTGENHWRLKNKEASARLADIHRRRMIANNPSCDKETREKMSSKLAEIYSRKIAKTETPILKVLKKYNWEFSHQHQVDSLLLDFALPLQKINIEADGRGHGSRVAYDIGRDKHLISLGWRVVRIQVDLNNIDNPESRYHDMVWLLVMLCHAFADISFYCPSPFNPPEHRGGWRPYWMLIRDKNFPAGREFEFYKGRFSYHPIRHSINAFKSASMR